MFSKKITAALLLLSLVQNQCSAMNVGKNFDSQIVKNVSFTIAGAMSGVLGTLLVKKIAGKGEKKDERKKQNPGEPSVNNFDNNKINFQLGKPLFRIMFTDGHEKCYINSLDERFNGLAGDSELSKMLNISKKNRKEKIKQFCQELGLNVKKRYQSRCFYEQLSNRVKKHYQDYYRNCFDYVLDKFDPCKLFYEVRETSEKDKLFLWVYGVDIFGKKLKIPYADFDAQGDARFAVTNRIAKFIKNTLNLECVEVFGVKDKVWLESQRFGDKAEEIEKYFTEKK